MNYDISQAETCYIMGYFWADCYFGYCPVKKNYEFSFEIKSDDFLQVWSIIQKLGFKKYTSRVRKNSNAKQCCVRISAKKDVDFFIQHKFAEKNSGCPLFYKLSKENQRCFIKGFLDGDGSISLDKNKLFRVGFNGNFEQKWDFLETFLTEHDIQYQIYRKKRQKHHKSHTKNHQYSVLEFTDLQSRINFCKLIENINIGLVRKIKIYENFKKERLQAQAVNTRLKKLKFD